MGLEGATGGAPETKGVARLVEGLVAMDGGRLGVARYRFLQVIQDAKGDASLEAGHGWRGLAELAMLEGDVAAAEEHLKHAVNVLRETARLRPASRVRAQEVEGLVLLLGGELLVRRGMPSTGDALFGRARVLLERLGDDRSAEAWGATGRLARVAGDLEAATVAYQRALSAYEEARNVVGRADVLLELALVRRGVENVLPMLDLAYQMAKDGRRSELAARVLIARASVLEDPLVARDVLSVALEHALDGGARVSAGMALVGLGIRGVEDAERAMIAGAQVLLDAEHYPALGIALLRIAQYAEGVLDIDLAMASLESAWRVFRSTEPVDGVGQVMRVMESVFIQQRAGRNLLATVFARAAVMGRRDPHAQVVRDHFASRAPPALVARLASSSREQLAADARRALQASVLPALKRYGLLASSFGTAQGALDVIGVLAGVSPRAAARQLAPFAPTPVPETLPEAAVPQEIEDAFMVSTIARITVGSDTPSQVMMTRSPIYDPTGRLAAMVRAGLSLADGEDGEMAAEAPVDDDAFPDDGGFASPNAEEGADRRAWLGRVDGERTRVRKDAAGASDDEDTEEVAGRSIAAEVADTVEELSTLWRAITDHEAVEEDDSPTVMAKRGVSTVPLPGEE